jgi:hypothetical protein
MPEDREKIESAVQDVRLSLGTAKQGPQKAGLLDQLAKDAKPGMDLALLESKAPELINS